MIRSFEKQDLRLEALNENLEKITSELEEVNEKLKEIVNIIPMETNDYIFLEISKNLKKNIGDISINGWRYEKRI